MYPECRFGLRPGPGPGPDSGVFVVEFDGPQGVAALYKMAEFFPQSDEEYWDGLTLLAYGSSKTYAFFRWPSGLSMRSHFRNPAPRTSISRSQFLGAPTSISIRGPT